MYSLIRCLLIFTPVAYVYCHHGPITATGEVAQKLHTSLFVTSGYNKRIRPRINQSDIILVNISLHVHALNELSETLGMLKTTAHLTVTWYDEFLQWNVSDYGGLYYYQYPQSEIWKPDIALKNSVLEYKELGVDSLNVELFSNGYIHWYPFQVFQSTCEVDITYFPFDTQTCNLRFLAWSYSYREVMMGCEYGATLDGFLQHPTWDILETGWDIVNDSIVPAVDFIIKLKRKPQYVISAVIMPVILLAVLNIFVFVLPSDSGEKAGYAITVFLAFAVFLTIVFSALPENSNSVALFSVFLITQIIQSTLITLVSLAIVRCYSFAETVPVPKCLQITLRALCCKTICEKKRRARSVTPIKPVKHSGAIILEQMGGSLDKHIRDSTDAAYGGIQDDDAGSPGAKGDSNKQEYTWKEAMNELDRVCFIFFTVVFVMSLLTCSALAAF